MGLRYVMGVGKERKDHSGIKFIVAEQLGDCMDCIFFRFHPSAPEQREYFLFHHKDYDGIGGLSKILNKLGHTNLSLPRLKDQSKPKFWDRVKLFFKFAQLAKIRTIEWKVPRDLSKRGRTDGLAYSFFTKEETAEFNARLQQRGFGQTAYLLWALDEIVQQYLLRPGAYRSWISPINMRGLVDVPNEYGNVAASIFLNPKGKQTPYDFHKNLKLYLKTKMHWGAWIYTNLAKWIGVSGLKWLAEKKQGGYLGVFSNMGPWPLQGTIIPEQEKKDFIWSVVAPASLMLPVAATALTWEGKLSLNLQLHPSLNKDHHFTFVLMQKWVEKIRSSLALPELKNSELAIPQELLYKDMSDKLRVNLTP